MAAFRLPFRFDPRALLRDLRGVPEAWWSLHPAYCMDGLFEGVALASPSGGVSDFLYDDPPRLRAVRPTPAVRRCPRLWALANLIPGAKGMVRLLRLKPGGGIFPHADAEIGLRLHVPLLTNPEVYMLFNGTRVPMRPGEVWAVNYGSLHEVYNFGSRERVHLVLDAAADEALTGLLRFSEPVRRAPRPPASRALAKRYLGFFDGPARSRQAPQGDTRFAMRARHVASLLARAPR